MYRNGTMCAARDGVGRLVNQPVCPAAINQGSQYPLNVSYSFAPSYLPLGTYVAQTF